MKIEIIETFINMAIEEMNEEVINKDLLMDRYIKAYLVEKITQKSVNYPEFLNLQFKDQRGFDKFNKNLQGEIYRLFLTLCRAVNKYIPGRKNKLEKKLERAIISFLDLKGASTVSLNTPINQDGKYTELMDLIPSKKWTAYEESKSALFEFENEEITIKIKPKYKKRIKPQSVKNPQIDFVF
jgi:hypothetical protein